VVDEKKPTVPKQAAKGPTKPKPVPKPSTNSSFGKIMAIMVALTIVVVGVGYLVKQGASKVVEKKPATGAAPAVPAVLSTPPLAVDDPLRWKNAINFLPLIDPAKDTVDGVWERKGDLLVGKPAFCANIELPYRPPAEYDFRTVFTRQTGSQSVLMVLSKNGHPFVWDMGGFFDTKWGFFFFGESTRGSNGTAVARKLESSRKYDVIVQVRNEVVRAFVDGVLIMEWPTDYSNARLSSNWTLRDDRLIGLGSDNGTALFERIEVLEISGKGTLTRPPQGSAAQQTR
jgi:hypothetical protein